MDIDNLKIGDTVNEYIYTMIGECVGCIECEIAQNLDGEKIQVVTDNHGGVGFISKGATKKLMDSRFLHQDPYCQVPDSEKRGKHVCSGCWFRSAVEDMEE